METTYIVAFVEMMGSLSKDDRVKAILRDTWAELMNEIPQDEEEE